MTLNDLEWIFHVKIRFRPELFESQRLNVKKILPLRFCRVLCTEPPSVITRRSDASLGTYAQLPRCFSAVAELLVIYLLDGTNV